MERTFWIVHFIYVILALLSFATFPLPVDFITNEIHLVDTTTTNTLAIFCVNFRQPSRVSYLGALDTQEATWRMIYCNGNDAPVLP